MTARQLQKMFETWSADGQPLEGGDIMKLETYERLRRPRVERLYLVDAAVT